MTQDYPLIPAADVQLRETATLLEALAVIDRTDAKIALVVDARNRLLGSVTDGDIRRGALAGRALDSPVRLSMHPNPYVLPAASRRGQVIEAMRAAQVKQMPLIEPDGRLKGIVVYDMIIGFLRAPRSNPVVIMAGGKGKRMLPLTRDIPKPMMDIGGKPMLEHILQQCVRQGFSRFYIAVNYLGHRIEEYFGDGGMWDCRIDYLRETEPLGTAGALSLIAEPLAEPFIVTNGDILSGADLGEVLDYHIAAAAAATVCARTHRLEVPFGVLELKDGRLAAITEKPVYENLISAGIYAMDAQALKHVPRDRATDMPALLQTLMEKRQPVAVFPLRDEWMDVGRLDDLVTLRQRLAEA